MHLNFSLEDAVYAHNTSLQNSDIAWDDKYLIAKQPRKNQISNNPAAAIAIKKVNDIGLLTVQAQ